MRNRWIALTGLLIGISLVLAMPPEGQAVTEKVGYQANPSPTPAGIGCYEDTDPSIIFNGDWSTSTSPYASGGSFARSRSAGATACLTFEGGGVHWYTLTYTSRGHANVYLDGSLVETVNNYSPTLHWQVVREYAVPHGTHTFCVEVAGDGFIDVDKICATGPTPTPSSTPTATPTPTQTPTPTPTPYWKPGGWVDYAPNGMPDFDQKQDAWDYPPGSGNWSYCGPLAVANCLWWFDSKMEPYPASPPVINDQYPLVQSYSPGQWDDHDPLNLPPFVEDLAWRMDTDGQQSSYPHHGLGTYVDDMYYAILEYLADHGLTEDYSVTMVSKPTFEWVENEVEQCEDVILLLGFWTQQYGSWERLGGHYVTMAGVDSLAGLVFFSDPFYDRAEEGWPGRVLDGVLIPHDPGHAHDVHNDAGNISHDMYHVVETDSPGGAWGPADYIGSQALEAYFGRNFPRDFPERYRPKQDLSKYAGASIQTEVEYAIGISPTEAPTPTPTPAGIGCYEDTNPSMVFNGDWSTGISPYASGSSFARSRSAGATACFTFEGNDVHWYTLTYTSRGHANVYLDGSLVETVNNYSPTLHWQVVREYAVSRGTHTFCVEVVGDGFIDVDKICVPTIR